MRSSFLLETKAINFLKVHSSNSFQEHIDIHLPMSIMGVVGGLGGISLLLIKEKSSKTST